MKNIFIHVIIIYFILIIPTFIWGIKKFFVSLPKKEKTSNIKTT